MSSVLSMTRDEILPIVWIAQTSKVSLNIIIDEKTDMLIVAGRNDDNNCELGFAITRAAIVDGRYREMLRPCLQQLVMMLEVDDELATRPPEEKSWRIH